MHLSVSTPPTLQTCPGEGGPGAWFYTESQGTQQEHAEGRDGLTAEDRAGLGHWATKNNDGLAKAAKAVELPEKASACLFHTASGGPTGSTPPPPPKNQQQCPPSGSTP